MSLLAGLTSRIWCHKTHQYILVLFCMFNYVLFSLIYTIIEPFDANSANVMYIMQLLVLVTGHCVIGMRYNMAVFMNATLFLGELIYRSLTVLEWRSQAIVLSTHFLVIVIHYLQELSARSEFLLRLEALRGWQAVNMAKV